jgi:hypothetical protein
VGLILDVAVAVLTLVVIGSLALLAWTLAVSSVRAIREGRREVAELRATVAAAERRLVDSAAAASVRMQGLAQRTNRPGETLDA